MSKEKENSQEAEIPEKVAESEVVVEGDGVGEIEECIEGCIEGNGEEGDVGDVGDVGEGGEGGEVGEVGEVEGEEQVPEAEIEKPLDHDQDRRNPQYIPKGGAFYEHDNRTSLEDV